MPIHTRLTTKGFEAFLEDLAKKGDQIETVAADALAAGAEVLVAGMKERAPKDTHHLENSISATPPQVNGTFVFTIVGLNGVDADTARYAVAQEYGWADHQGKKAGHPYIRPTIDGDMARARAAMRDVFKTRGML